MSEAQADVKVPEIEVSVEVKNIIETLIFACDEPMTVRMIRGIIDEANKDRLPHEQLVVNADIIRKAVGDLNRGYGRLGSGFRIIEIAGGFVYATQEQFAVWVGKLAKEKARRRLSPTAVETLAIVAYKQPITKSEVEFIRGVNVDYIINALLEKDLIQITGRQNSPGRPLLYGTTPKFLEHFGLNELTDLPKPREIAELISETEIEVDRRLLAEQQELEFRESLENKLEGHEGAAKKEKKSRQPKVRIADDTQNEQTDRKPSVETTPAAATVETEGQTHQDVASSVDQQSGNMHEDISGIAAESETAESSDAVPGLTHNNAAGLPAEISQDDIHDSRESTKPALIFGEEGALPSTSSTTIAENPDYPLNAPDQVSEHEHGWSKWKNKVKTFFKKLFA